MAAFSISFVLLNLLFKELDTRPIGKDQNFDEIKLQLLIVAIITSSLVCLSRVYLGMHSILDIIGGLLYSFVLSIIIIKIVDSYGEILINNLMVGVIGYFGCILLCLIYPEKERWSSARSDTFLIVGVGGGMIIGYILKQSLGWKDIGKIKKENEHSIYLWLIRSLIGSIIVLTVRFLSMKILYDMIRKVNKIDKSVDNIKLKTFIKTNFLNEFTFYFFTYSNISFTVIFTNFLIFEYFQIF
jgi:sphingosine-1-phosphate phosphatase 1